MFKLERKHKKWFKRTAAGVLALAGFVGVGYAAGQQLKANDAKAAVFVVKDNFDTYWVNTRAGSNITNTDTFGPAGLDGGEWVWCIEPTIVTEAGRSYHAIGDIMKEDANYVVRRGDTKQEVVMTFSDKIAGILPWVFHSMSEADMYELVDGYTGDSKATAERAVKSMIALRSAPDYVQYTVVQLYMWQYVGEGFDMPTHVNPGYRSNGGSSDGDAAEKQKAADVNNALNLQGWGLDAYKVSNYRLVSYFNLLRQCVEQKIKSGDFEYHGGAQIWESDDVDPTTGKTYQRLVNGAAGRIEGAKGYLKAKKKFSDIKGADPSTKPDFDEKGLKIGVYRDVNATDKVGELTFNENGETETMKVKKGRYYGFELDGRTGEPVKTSGQLVADITDAEHGYVSGSDEKNTTRPYVIWDVETSNKDTNPDTETFVNTPQVVNFKIKKVAVNQEAADGAAQQSGIYTFEGAEYTLYKDAKCTEPVIRDGKPIVAVIGKDGYGSFENLYRGKYYVKETKNPHITIDGVETNVWWGLSSEIKEVDLSTTTDNQTATGDSTATPTLEFALDKDRVKSSESTPSQDPPVIRKQDAENKNSTAQGQATFKGAEFKVEFFGYAVGRIDDSKKLFEAVYVTDEKGEFKLSDRAQIKSVSDAAKMEVVLRNYEVNKYWNTMNYRVTEIKAPNGYKLPNPVKVLECISRPNNSGGANNPTTWTYSNDTIYDYDLELRLMKVQRASGNWLPQDEAKKVVIKDATFELTNKTTGKKLTATTDSYGTLRFDGVVAGEYTLKETGAKKYQTNGQVINLTVAQQDGTTKLVASSTSVPTDKNGAFDVSEMTNGNIAVTVENTPIEAKAKVIKVNEKGARLEGATFKVTHYDETGTKQIGDSKEITTNDKGELDFSDIIIGHWYKVEEVKAPTGYKLPVKRQILNFRAESIPAKDSYAVTYRIDTLDKTNENNTTVVKGQTHKISKEDVVENGISINADKDKGTMELEFDVVNNTMQKLPTTGSHAGLIVGVVATVVVIGSAVVYVKKRHA